VVLRALEHQVLEEMRETRPARPLVLRADVIPDVHRHDRHVMVFVNDDVEAVVQRAFGEGELEGRHVQHRNGKPAPRRT
jgi:hypothetical protein